MIPIDPHSSSQGANTKGPFGDSDASNVDFSILKKGLINFSDKDAGNAIANSFRVDSHTRIIFGKKGAGKTLYLKLLQDYCRQNSSDRTGVIYFTAIDNMPPESRTIIKITNWFDEHSGMADEMWRKLWYVAILRTIYCHVFNRKEFKKFINKNLKTSFVSRYEKILPTHTIAISLLRQLENVLTRFNSLKDLTTFLELQEWAEFETEIAELLNDLPPIYFFIDGIDDDYVNAPHHWLRCQVGLFNCVFRMLRSQLIGTRLHVIVCLREFVYSYVLHTQHGSRYLEERKIKVLKWDRETLKFFLDKKIEMLGGEYFINQEGEKNIINLVGIKELFNHRHEKHEDIYQYIFRHTMLMPRDIINIGNVFCNNLISLEKKEDLQRLLRKSVHDVAKQIATEHLLNAALLINTRWIYKGAIEQDNLDSYTDKMILEHTQENLKSLIKSIDKDRFSLEELLEKKGKLEQHGFTKEDFPFTALYHSGLLGFVAKDHDDKDIILSFSELRLADYNLPLTSDQYVFHSCLIDALNIRPIGDPVVFN